MSVSSQKDSRSKSLSGVIILPISMGWMQDDIFTANIFITLVYATVSFLRIYYLRRVFERVGFDDNFIRLGMKFYLKVRRRIF